MVRFTDFELLIAQLLSNKWCVELGFLSRFSSCVKKKEKLLYPDCDLQQHQLLVSNSEWWSTPGQCFSTWQIYWLTYQMWRINEYDNKSVCTDNWSHNDTRLSQGHKYARHGIITQWRNIYVQSQCFKCIWGLRPQLRGTIYLFFAIIAFYLIGPQWDIFIL